MVWNPDQYHIYSDHRMRPALDLLSQVQLVKPLVIYDLGCGTGSVTSLLSRKWNASIVVGVDNSAEMLAKAKEEYPAIEWQQSDISDFNPSSAGHLIFSNAALHWLDNHETLLPDLLGRLIPGGVLAVQMPNNFQAPSHQILYDLAQSDRWQSMLGHLVRPAPVHKLEWYYDLLSSKVANLNLWETTYFQVLGGKNAVLEWTRGTALRPFLAALDSDEERNSFEQEYADLLLDAYPQQEDGSTIYPFSRLFIVAETESD